MSIHNSTNATRIYVTGVLTNEITAAEDAGTSLEIIVPGEGVILESPDASKRVKLTIDNNGDIITTPV